MKEEMKERKMKIEEMLWKFKDHDKRYIQWFERKKKTKEEIDERIKKKKQERKKKARMKISELQRRYPENEGE